MAQIITAVFRRCPARALWLAPVLLATSACQPAADQQEPAWGDEAFHMTSADNDGAVIEGSPTESKSQSAQ